MTEETALQILQECGWTELELEHEFPGGELDYCEWLVEKLGGKSETF